MSADTLRAAAQALSEAIEGERADWHTVAVHPGDLRVLLAAFPVGTTGPDPAIVALRPARRGGFRRLPFDNGRHEDYDSVFVSHPGGEWDRILIARDDGTIATALATLINGNAPPATGADPEHVHDPLVCTDCGEVYERGYSGAMVPTSAGADPEGLDVERHPYTCEWCPGEWPSQEAYDVHFEWLGASSPLHPYRNPARLAPDSAQGEG